MGFLSKSPEIKRTSMDVLSTNNGFVEERNGFLESIHGFLKRLQTKWKDFSRKQMVLKIVEETPSPQPPKFTPEETLKYNETLATPNNKLKNAIKNEPSKITASNSNGVQQSD